MSNDSKKLLTLGNVEAIKDYIDTTSGNIKYYIDENVKDELNNKIEQVEKTLDKKFTDKSTELINKISELEQLQGNKEEIDELKLELDALNANHANINSALDALKQEIQDVNSIFSGGQINEIIKTALITEVDIQPDKILTPEMLATKIVALIGNFGQINATNIIGSEISGKTIKSIDDKWLLNNNGSGMLANGNISWDENGNVVFGPDVKLNWNNIEGSDDATDGVAAAMSAATAAAAAAATAQATANEATALANEAKNSIPSEERITEITRNSITTENITGTTISGKTIKSTDDKWELTSTGAGKLANGNITWTDDGVVTFSDNVELKWGNITGAPTIPEGSGGLSETEVNNLIATQITNSGITADTIEGKTVKSVDGKWELNRDGSGCLGNFDGVKAIEWDADGVKIQGENVEISGDVKINGAAIITGITENESAQQSFNTMVADCIDASEIKTEVLETKPDEGTDKIHIEDNYIHCINGDGMPNLIISSNDINESGYISALANNSYIYGYNIYKESGTLAKHEGAEISLDKLLSTTSDWFTNSASWLFGDNYSGIEGNMDYIPVVGQSNSINAGKIGYVLGGSTISLDISLWVTKNADANNRINTTTWEPIIDDEHGFNIYIYKADTNDGAYTHIDTKRITNTWVADSENNMYTTGLIIDVDATDNGFYAIELGCTDGSIKYKTTSKIDLLVNGCINTIILQNAPNQYTEIGKNGMIFTCRSYSRGVSVGYNTTNINALHVMTINEDDIVLMCNTQNEHIYDPSYGLDPSKKSRSISHYINGGIKINKDGLHICGTSNTGHTNWKKLNFEKAIELGLFE